MNKVRILVLQDDFEMRALMIGQLKDQFKADSFVFMDSGSGKDALQKLKEANFSLVILDEKLPEISGLDVMRAAKQFSKCKYLLITNRAENEDLIEIFEAGAHDFLLRPFERSLLMTRVRSLVIQPIEKDSQKIQLGSIVIYPKSYDVFCGSDRVHLTPSEFKLLHVLAIHRGEVMTRDQLIEAVQGEGIAVIDRAIDTHIFGLRKKLGTTADVVETVRGVGYRVSAGS